MFISKSIDVVRIEVCFYRWKPVSKHGEIKPPASAVRDSAADCRRG